MTTSTGKRARKPQQQRILCHDIIASREVLFSRKFFWCHHKKPHHHHHASELWSFKVISSQSRHSITMQEERTSSAKFLFNDVTKTALSRANWKNSLDELLQLCSREQSIIWHMNKQLKVLFAYYIIDCDPIPATSDKLRNASLCYLSALCELSKNAITEKIIARFAWKRKPSLTPPKASGITGEDLNSHFLSAIHHFKIPYHNLSISAEDAAAFCIKQK